MNLQQAKELHTLISTVRHVEKMDVGVGPRMDPTIAGCLLCEGVRHELYSRDKGNLAVPSGFSPHFGCTAREAECVIFHWHIRGHECSETTGENYFQAGKELIEKYGFADLFEETALPFNKLMFCLKQPLQVSA